MSDPLSLTTLCLVQWEHGATRTIAKVWAPVPQQCLIETWRQSLEEIEKSSFIIF